MAQRNPTFLRRRAGQREQLRHLVRAKPRRRAAPLCIAENPEEQALELEVADALLLGRRELILTIQPALPPMSGSMLECGQISHGLGKNPKPPKKPKQLERLSGSGVPISSSLPRPRSPSARRHFTCKSAAMHCFLQSLASQAVWSHSEALRSRIDALSTVEPVATAHGTLSYITNI